MTICVVYHGSAWPGEQRLSDASFQEIEKSVQQLRQSRLEKHDVLQPDLSNMFDYIYIYIYIIAK